MKPFKPCLLNIIMMRIKIKCIQTSTHLLILIAINVRDLNRFIKRIYYSYKSSMRMKFKILMIKMRS